MYFISNYQQFLRPILVNLGVGCSLTLFQTLLCSSHYNHFFFNSDIIINNFLITSFSYGMDRYFDALDYSIDSNKEKYSLSKQNLYDSILNNESFYINLYHIIYLISVIRFLVHNEITKGFSFLLFLTYFYKDFKTAFPIIKPFYISFMWIMAGLVLPICWLNNSNELLFNKNEFLSYFLLFFSMTNLLDIKDYKEDLNNQIYTIPVIVGEKYSFMLNNIIFIIGILLLKNQFNIFNEFLILSNLLFLISFKLDKKN